MQLKALNRLATKEGVKFNSNTLYIHKTYASTQTNIVFNWHAVDILDELKSVRERLAFFRETKQSYGSSALMLSGGATLGLLHTGVIKTLLEQRLMPKVVSGSSAGAIVVAMLGTMLTDTI